MNLIMYGIAGCLMATHKQCIAHLYTILIPFNKVNALHSDLIHQNAIIRNPCP